MAQDIVWSDLHHGINTDSQGALKRVVNVDSVYTSIDNILGTFQGERCITGTTLVELVNKAPQKIQDLVNEKVSVYTYNETSHEIEPSLAISSYVGEENVFEVRLSNNEVLECTEDQLILTEAGNYIKACLISDGLRLKTFYGNVIKVVSVTDLKIKKPVYDLQVINNHNFVLASGIIIHNCMLPEFASNLKSMLFEPMDERLQNQVANEIKRVIEKWDDRPKVMQVDYFADPDRNSISIVLYFRIAGYEKIFEYSKTFATGG